MFANNVSACKRPKSRASTSDKTFSLLWAFKVANWKNISFLNYYTVSFTFCVTTLFACIKVNFDRICRTRIRIIFQFRTTNNNELLLLEKFPEHQVTSAIVKYTFQFSTLEISKFHKEARSNFFKFKILAFFEFSVHPINVDQQLWGTLIYLFPANLSTCV